VSTLGRRKAKGATVKEEKGGVGNVEDWARVRRRRRGRRRCGPRIPSYRKSVSK